MARSTPAEMAETWQRMPSVRKAWNLMGKALFEEGSLDAPLQDMVRIRSARIQGCQR